MRRCVASLVLLLGLSVATSLSKAQTVDFNDSSVIQPVTKRVGLNIGSLNFYDSGQILQNLVGSLNPGFEAPVSQQIWVLDSNGTTTAFPIPDIYYSGPWDYWQGATFTVTQSESGGAELGCTGTILASPASSYPNEPVFTVSQPCSAPFAIGDVIVLKSVASPTPESWWENNEAGLWASSSNGGKLTSDTTDLCATCGSQALTMDATATGSTAGATWYFDAAPGLDLFVLMNGTYHISFWAKTASGNPQITVTSQRFSTNGFNCGTYTQTPSSTWTQYTFTCTPSEQASTVSPETAFLTVSVAGGAIYFDNVAFQKVQAKGDPNNTVLRDEVFSTIQRYYAESSGGNPGPFRYWIEQNAETLNDWTLPDYAHAPSISGDKYYIGPGGSGGMQLSLEDYLTICQALGAEPYLEVPVTFSTADASGLIDFLAGGANTTYGARRIALGQASPWTYVFNIIHLDFCNECWNAVSFPGQNIPHRGGTPNDEEFYDYSYVAKAMFAAMRASPSYSSSAFDLVMNAQTGVNYSMDAAIQRASPDSIEIEDYQDTSVSDYSTDAALWTSATVEPWDTVVDASDPSNFYQSVHDYQSQNTCGPSGTSACKVNLYEWGPGTQLGSIDQTHLDYITAGGGEAVVAALLPLLNLQYDGILNQSYFSLTGYQNNGPNNESAKIWGNTIDMGGATNNVRPQFLALSLINQSIIGQMYSCPIANNATFNFSGDTYNGVSVPPGSLALNNVPLLYAFCFVNGTNRSVVLINSDLTGYHTVSFAGTNPPAGTVTVRQLAPPSLDSLNEAPSGHVTNATPATMAIATSTVSTPSSLTLPPHSVTALDYSVPLPGPTFSLTPGIYPPGQTVSLAESAAGATIHYTLDGSTPTTNSPVYSSPIMVSATKTISAIAVASTLTSSVSTGLYTIFNLPSAPTFSIPAGTYQYGQTVTISDSTYGALIYYTTNGTTPTAASTLYTGPISLTASETLNAIAVANTLAGPATSAQYTVIPKTAVLYFYTPYAVTYGNGVPFQVPSYSTPTPTGAVTVSINGQVFGTSTQWYEGQVTQYETTATQAAGWVVGNNTVTMSFAGDAIYAPQTISQTVYFSLMSTTTSLTASNTAPMAGSNITLTATTSPAAAPGTVTFMDGGTTLATVSLSGGTAIYSVNTIVAGAHSYTAVYNGNTSYATSTSAAVSVSATAPSYTSLAPATYTPVAGSNLVLTATTSPSTAGGTVTFMEGGTSLGTNTLTNGVATLTVYTITTGTHYYTAVYGGSSNYGASTSSAITVSATAATAAMQFYVPYTVTYGNAVDFVMQASAPYPTGNVTFSVNGKTLITSNQWYPNTINFYETSATPTDGWVVGNNTVTAAFAGDSIYAPQTLSQTVAFSLIPTTTNLGASGQTPVVGNSITLTAYVAPATSTGTVTFFDGSANLGTVALSGTQAAYTVNAITVGAHNYTATYNGNTSNGSSTSTAVTVTGQPASTTTGMSASSLNPIAGTSETLTAAVSPSVATGTVTFLDGGSPVGTGTLSGGVASYTIGSIAVGTHTYTASYGGSASYVASTSSPVSVTAKIQTTTGLFVSNTSPVALTNVTLTSTTSPNAATGTVLFFDGSTSLGSAIPSSGTAIYTVVGITGGAHSYTASYGGSGAYTSSASSAVAVNASLAPTTMSLAVSNPSPVALTAETLTVTISPSVATGTVTFLDNGANLGTATISNGFATFYDGAIAGGSHSFTASYPGTINYAGTAAAPVGVTATPAPTSVALSASSTTPVALTTVVLTAWITPSAATGTVTFQDGGTILGYGAVTGGTATFTVNAIAVGAHSYTASYGGTGNYATSTSSALAVTASAAATTTTLTSSNMNPVYLASIVLTANTSPSGAGGTVTFYDNGSSIGSGTLASGAATFTVNLIAVGAHSYTAAYGGAGNYGASTSSALAITAQPAPTTTSLSASNTAPTALTSITLTATTTPPAAAGTVTFYDNGSFIGTGALSSGTATFAVTAISGGAHSYTATYGGSTTYATSTSSALAVTASPAGTLTTLSASSTAPMALSSITLTSTTSPSGATGTVTFYDGATSIGTATPSGGIATFSVPSINGGAHSYTASYGGNSNYAVSTSSAVSVTAQPVTTTTTLTTPNTTPSAGSNITLTATMSLSGATGTVNFFDGATSLGPGNLAGGIATYTVNAIIVGPHSYTASYAGSANYATSTSSALSVTAQPVTTTTTLAASSATPTAGANITLTATTTPNTATGAVNFYDGATYIGFGTLSGGTATIGITAITGGAHSYTASYPGVTGYSASTSSAVSVTAQSISSTTTLAASNTAPVAGTNITLTASTSPSAATGTVTFYDSGVSIGTASLSSGAAAFTVSAIVAGTHNYTASYGGNAYYLTSSSTAVTVAAQTVVVTTTILAASNTAPAPGSSVTLTATTSPSTTPGSITFYDGGNVIGTGALGSGVATYIVGAISGGIHSYSAAYAGSANYAASTSAAVTVTASSGPWVSTTFNEYAGGHALAATAPVNDGPGSTWTDPNGDWKYVSGGGIVSGGADLTNPALININQANYAASFTYPASGAILLFRYVDASDYVYAETYSFGAIGLYSRVAGASSQLAIIWTSSPAAPLTVTLNGSTGTIASGGQTASGTIPSSLLTGTQMGFFAPAASFTVSSLSVTLISSAAATTTTLSASNTAPVAVTNITLTAATSPSAAAGTVTFLDGANVLGTGTLNGSGVATFLVTGITGGAHSYTASYGGNSSYGASTSSALAVTASPAATTTTLSASNTAPTALTNITLTAATSSAATGTVTFYDGGTSLGTSTLSGGTAAFAVTAITGGAHSYTATYGGNTNYATSTSSALVVTASPAATTNTLAASSTAPAAGASVTLTATLAPTGATGTVTFFDGVNSVGTGALSGGAATYTISSIAAGSHSYTASYAGNATYAASTSSAVAVVTLTASTTTLSASNTNPAVGASVILTANLAPTAAAGTVTFKDAGVTIGTGNLSGGSTTFTVTSITAGTHSYTAVYGGNSTYAASTSAAVPVTTQTIATTTALSASSTTPVAGTSITLSAAVSSNTGTAAGTATFYDGGVSIGTGMLNGSGVATFTVTAIAGGAHSYTATYGGSTTYAASTSSAVAVNASAAATTTTLSASNTAPAAGANITLTATLSSITATGSVTFYDAGGAIGTGTLSSGAATFTVTGIAAGSHSYTASYGGSANYTASTSAAVSVTANSGPYISTTFNEYASGHALAATAPVADGSGSTWTDSNGDWSYVSGGGVVSNKADLTNPALININSANYAATFTYPASGAILLFRYVDASDYVYAETYSFGAIGLYSKVAGANSQLAIIWTSSPAAPLTVTLNGSTGTIASGGQTASGTIPSSLLTGTQTGFFASSASFTVSSLNVTLTSSATATTTTLGASNTAPVALTNITLTATTMPSGAAGTVTFLDNGNTIGTGTLSGGTATFAVTGIAGGAHSYTASYGGNSSYGSSTSSALAVTASPAATTTTLSASNATPVALTNITLTATNSSSAAAGTVTFYDGGTSIGTGTLNGSGVATFTVTAIAGGAHSYTATFGGNATYAASTSSAVAVTASAAATTNTLAASSTAPAVGASVTLTVTLAPTGATGTVTFYDGGISIGTGTLSSGVATFTVNPISAGSHSYTASYAGNATYAASTSSAVAVVTLAASTTTLSASNTNPAVGASINLNATVAPTAATGSVNFYDNGVNIGIGAVIGSAATVNIPAITAGTHSYTAVYGGNTTYAASTSAAVPVTTLAAATTTSLSASNTAPAAGSSITLSATVSSSAGTAAGTVSFLDGANTIGTGTLNGSGVATFTVPTVTSGTHSYTAVYAGNANYTGSTSAAVAVTTSSGPYVTTTFNEYAAGHALAATAPATDGSGSTWTDPNSDWTYAAGGGVTASHADLTNPGLINIGSANYSATFTYPATGAILLFRYVDASDYVYAETYSFGAIGLYSRVAGASSQLAVIWTGSPAAPLTVTLNGSTGTIASGGQTASGTIPSSLLTGTQTGFFAPSANFVISSLNVTP